MQVRSAKAKGKRLEKYVRDKLLITFPEVDPETVRVAVGAETGSDVKLSSKALEIINLAIECKARESYKGLYSAYEQAQGHVATAHPVLIVRANHKPALAVIDFDWFLKLLRCEYESARCGQVSRG